MATIEINKLSFIVPDAFKHVLWKDVNEGDVVYIIGTSNKKPFAYGPYTVHNKAHRELKNNSPRLIGGRVFMEYPESLLVQL